MYYIITFKSTSYFNFAIILELNISREKDIELDIISMFSSFIKKLPVLYFFYYTAIDNLSINIFILRIRATIVDFNVKLFFTFNLSVV